MFNIVTYCVLSRQPATFLKKYILYFTTCNDPMSSVTNNLRKLTLFPYSSYPCIIISSSIIQVMTNDDFICQQATLMSMQGREGAGDRVYVSPFRSLSLSFSLSLYLSLSLSLSHPLYLSLSAFSSKSLFLFLLSSALLLFPSSGHFSLIL